MDLLLEKFSETDFADYLKLVSNIDVMAMITERAIPCDEASRDFKLILTRMPAIQIWAITESRMISRVILSASPNWYLWLTNRRPPNWAICCYRNIGGLVLRAKLPRYWSSRPAETLKSPHSLRLSILRTCIKKILIKNSFITREFRDFDGLPGEILQRAV